jgi:hypothetical protein
MVAIFAHVAEMAGLKAGDVVEFDYLRWVRAAQTVRSDLSP